VARRRALAAELAPLRAGALAAHPWKEWANAMEEGQRMPGARSRWNAGKDLSWEPLRIDRVCEVKYDHLQGRRFRHAATFLRWRPDKQPADCRYDQLEVTPAYELAAIFGAGPRLRWRAPRPTGRLRVPAAPGRDAGPAGRARGSRGCGSRSCGARAWERPGQPGAREWSAARG